MFLNSLGSHAISMRFTRKTLAKFVSQIGPKKVPRSSSVTS